MSQNENLYERAKREGNPISPSSRGLTDPPVPRMALPRQGAGHSRTGALPLPPPTAPGELPPEDSRLWMFVPKAVQRGEDWVQDDTREWFEERGRKVPISREYLDHPRWVTGAAGNTIRGRLYNGGIVSEVHMLARISAGRPDYPAWVPARLSVKQVQADVAHRLTKMTRETLLTHGKTALKDFAQRAPGQFIKFVGATFIPKRLETEATVRTESMDAETADALIEALSAELERRGREAKIIAMQGGNDWPDDIDPKAGFAAHAQELRLEGHKKFAGTFRAPNGTEPEIIDIVMEPEDGPPEFEWD